MFELTEVQKIGILSICLSLVALTVLLTVCAVTPTCWLHSYVSNLEKKLMKKKKTKEEETEITAQLRLVGSPQYTVEAGPPRMPSNEVTSPTKSGRKHREDSTYSSMSTSSRGDGSISTYSEISLDCPVSVIEPEVNYGQVTFNANYKTEEQQSSGQLILVLKEVQDLPPRQYGGTCDPYITMTVFKDKGKKRWSKGSSLPLYDFKTTTKKKTQHPLFKETFAMDLAKSDIKECSIKISAYDEEKLANDTELGELIVPLRELSLLAETPESHLHTFDFHEPKQERGELLLGLNYLPTAERLTFSLLKANNLRFVTETLDTFAPCVRILLILNGKLVKKKKTSSKLGTNFPVFNETLTFDIPPSQLDNVTFLVVVSHRDDTEASSPDSPTSPNTIKKSRHVGKVVVGSSCRGIALHHWNAMKQSPRKQVTQWHTLR